MGEGLSRWAESEHPRDEKGRWTESELDDALTKAHALKFLAVAEENRHMKEYTAESAERAAKVAIEKEGSGLSRDGALTRSRYDELHVRALKAAGGHREHLVTLEMFAPPR